MSSPPLPSSSHPPTPPPLSFEGVFFTLVQSFTLLFGVHVQRDHCCILLAMARHSHPQDVQCCQMVLKWTKLALSLFYLKTGKCPYCSYLHICTIRRDLVHPGKKKLLFFFSVTPFKKLVSFRRENLAALCGRLFS